MSERDTYELHTLEGKVYHADAEGCHLRGSDGSAVFLRTENTLTSLRNGAKYNILPDGRVIGENGIQLGFLHRKNSGEKSGASVGTGGTSSSKTSGASNASSGGTSAGTGGTASAGSTGSTGTTPGGAAPAKSGGSSSGKGGCFWFLLVAVILFFVIRHFVTSPGSGSSGVDQAVSGFTLTQTATPTPTAALHYEDVLGDYYDGFDDAYYPVTKPAWANNLNAYFPAGTVYLDASSGVETDLFHDQIGHALRRKAPAICFRDYKLYSAADFYDIGYASYGAFWMENVGETGHATYTDSSGTHTVYLYQISYYNLSNTQIQSMVDQIIAEANRITDMIPPYADEWTSAKIIHDELCRSVSYDGTYSAPHRHDLYGALVNHNAVCSAYTSAFAFLMYSAGYWGEGVYSDTHAWNCLYVPSQECFVDATWDDLNSTDRYGRPYIRYDFFFLTADEVARVDAHTQIGHGASFGNTGGYEAYNYFRHEGYMLYSSDKQELVNAFRRQLADGANLLTVRYSSWNDYQNALNRAWDGTMMSILQSAGYNDVSAYLSNDDLQIFIVLLYYPSE